MDWYKTTPEDFDAHLLPSHCFYFEMISSSSKFCSFDGLLKYNFFNSGNKFVIGQDH